MGGGGSQKINQTFDMSAINKSIYEEELARLRSRQMSGFYTFTDTPDVYYKQLFATYWVKETTKS